MQKIILASESPRRREMLSRLGINYIACSSCIEEHLDTSKSIEEGVQQLALDKAKAVIAQYPHDLILAADSVVVVDNEVLGKPKDEENAKEMLRLLSGREHRVISGVAIISAEKEETFFEETIVTFYELDETIIQEYIETKEYKDKAGAYGIQGKGCILVRKINGDYYNVVGLPLAATLRKLR